MNNTMIDRYIEEKDVVWFWKVSWATFNRNLSCVTCDRDIFFAEIYCCLKFVSNNIRASCQRPSDFVVFLFLFSISLIYHTSVNYDRVLPRGSHWISEETFGSNFVFNKIVPLYYKGNSNLEQIFKWCAPRPNHFKSSWLNSHLHRN